MSRIAAAAVLSCVFMSPGRAPAQNNINEYGPPESGYGLTPKEALDGWISLFDGKTTFGWEKANVMNGQLVGGNTTTSFAGKALVFAEFAKPGVVEFAGHKRTLTLPRFVTVDPLMLQGPIKLADGVVLKQLKVKFVDLTPIYNGKDLSNWKPVNHPKLPKERAPRWEVKDGFIHALGGPGALEYTKEHFGDGVLQIEVRTRAKHTNGGLFFRCVPEQMMNGYEAQIYNRCEDGDVAKPSKWSTGAIDDRQNARRVVSRDGVPFVMTVIASGPHIATWVNGYQQVDWTDRRAKHENPRQGLRLEAGPIQLQAHDTGTDIEFRALRMAKWAK